MSKIELVGVSSDKFTLSVTWDGKSEPEIQVDGARFNGDGRDEYTYIELMEAIIEKLHEWLEDEKAKPEVQIIRVTE